MRKDKETTIARQKTYIRKRLEGKRKSEAIIEAGFSPSTKAVDIENTATFKNTLATYKDTVLNLTTLTELAELSLRNARNERDLGASNNAIKELIAKIEPENAPPQEDRVVVILRENTPILPETEKNASLQAPYSPDNEVSSM